MQINKMFLESVDTKKVQSFLASPRVKTIVYVALAAIALYAVYKLLSWSKPNATIAKPILISTKELRDIRNQKKHFPLSQIDSKKAFAKELDDLGLKIRATSGSSHIDVDASKVKGVESIVVKQGLRTGCIYHEVERLVHKGEWGQPFESLEGVEIVVTRKNSVKETYKLSFKSETANKTSETIKISKQKLQSNQQVSLHKLIDRQHAPLNKTDIRIAKRQNHIEIVSSNGGHDLSIEAITTIDTSNQRGYLFTPDGPNSKGTTTLKLPSIEDLKQIEIKTLDGNITTFNIEVVA